MSDEATQQDLCHRCSGKLKSATTTRFQEYEGEWFVFENLPALICEQCGEVYYTPETHDVVVIALKKAIS